jgi:hypothetical protein
MPTTRARHFRPIPITTPPLLKQAGGTYGEDLDDVKRDMEGKPGPCRPGTGCQDQGTTDPLITMHSQESPRNDSEQTSEPLINTHRILASFSNPLAAPEHETPGKFIVAGDSGVPAMHAALMPNGKVMFLDKIENYTQLTFENGEFAYSSEWDPVSGKVTPLAYKARSERPSNITTLADHS